MADVIKELLDSIDAFENEMNKNLKKTKYDDVIVDYLNLRKKFRDLYDITLEIKSKANDIISDKRHETNYLKNSKAQDAATKIK